MGFPSCYTVVLFGLKESLAFSSHNIEQRQESRASQFQTECALPCQVKMVTKTSEKTKKVVRAH